MNPTVNDRRVDDRMLARLLSGRDTPSIRERETIAAAVLPHRRWSRTQWLRFASLSLATACAVLAIISVPKTDVPKTDEFRARGGAVSWQARCVDTASCHTGDTLRLRAPVAHKPYVAVLLRYEDEIVWWNNALTNDLVLDRPGDVIIEGLASDVLLDRVAVKQLLQSHDQPHDYFQQSLHVDP